jgi:site-specific recombinase XerD
MAEVAARNSSCHAAPRQCMARPTKSRLLPLHPSSMQALEGYTRLRDHLQPRPAEPAFFVSLNRKRLLYAVVSQTFRQLINNAGIGAGAASPPRLHDLRHTFAVRTPLAGGRAVQDPVAVDLPGSPRAGVYLLVPVGSAGTACAGRRPAGHSVVSGPAMTLIAPTLQAFFTDRLVQQSQASPQTIAAYRDTLRLLLTFVHQRTGKMPAQLDWDNLDASTISAFLNHLEGERRNSTRTRNLRLTAIRSLFSYAAPRTHCSSSACWRSPRNGPASGS